MYPYDPKIDPTVDIIEPIIGSKLDKIMYIDAINITRNGKKFTKLPDIYIEDSWNVQLSVSSSLVQDGNVVLQNDKEIPADDLRAYNVDVLDIIAQDPDAIDCITKLRKICMRIVLGQIIPVSDELDQNSIEFKDQVPLANMGDDEHA